MTKTQTKTRTKTASSKQDEGDIGVVTNDVRLVGRLSAEPTTVELPSGDTLVTFRISVPRRTSSTSSTSPGRGAAASQRVDSIPCTAWVPRLRRSIVTWRAGDLVEVVGAVRCRFYQAGGATRSRVEVEASAARIMRRSTAA